MGEFDVPGSRLVAATLFGGDLVGSSVRWGVRWRSTDGMAAEHRYRWKSGDDNAEEGEQRREKCCSSKERGGRYD